MTDKLLEFNKGPRVTQNYYNSAPSMFDLEVFFALSNIKDKKTLGNDNIHY